MMVVIDFIISYSTEICNRQYRFKWKISIDCNDLLDFILGSMTDRFRFQITIITNFRGILYECVLSK